LIQEAIVNVVVEATPMQKLQKTWHWSKKRKGKNGIDTNHSDVVPFKNYWSLSAAGFNATIKKIVAACHHGLTS
jgi:hypothetical protein